MWNSGSVPMSRSVAWNPPGGTIAFARVVKADCGGSTGRPSACRSSPRCTAGPRCRHPRDRRRLWCRPRGSRRTRCSFDVCPDANDLFDIRLVLNLENVGNEVCQRDDGFRPAVAQHVADLAGLVLGIHRDDDPAGTKRAVEGGDELRQVREIDSDAVALADAAVLERLCELPRSLPELLVGPFGP